MKKVTRHILVAISIIFLCNQFTFAQTWSSLNGTLNNSVTSGIAANNKTALFAGQFTSIVNGPLSPLCVKYSTQNNEFSAISGFDSLTDKINGFFVRDGFLYTFGYFKEGTKHYAAKKFNSNFTSASAEPQFEFKGPFAPFARVKAIGTDNDGNALFFGDTLARMGTGSGVNLMTARVGYMTPDGVVTAVSILTPAHATETATIYTIDWHEAWFLLGNYQNLGVTECTDIGKYDGNTVTAINTSSDPNLYCKGFSANFFGWNGTAINGVESPGGWHVIGTNLEPLNGGWNINTLSVTGVASNLWFAGSYKNNSGSRIATWNQNDNTWLDQQSNLIASGNTTDAVNGVLSMAGDTMIAYGPFSSNFPGLAMTVASNPPLPVELISFSAEVARENNVLLRWKTASENKNEGFHVERSNNGISWNSLAFVSGYGTTAIEHEYVFTDSDPIGDANYYRLRQQDSGGKFTFSPIVIVTMPKKDGFVISPNPTNNSVRLLFGNEAEKDIVVQIFDISGKIHLEWKITEAIDLSLDLTDLSPGNYTISVTANGKMATKKLIIN